MSTQKRRLMNLLGVLVEMMTEYELARFFIDPVDARTYPQYERVSVVRGRRERS